MKVQLKNIIVYILVIVLLTVILFPFYWMFTSSLKPIEEILTRNPTLVPIHPTLSNYMDLINPAALYGGWERGGRFFLIFIQNSLIVAGGSTVISVFLSVLGGYSLARFRYRGRELIAGSMLFVYMFPGVLLLVPMYELMSKAHLLDTHLSLIMVYVTFSAPFSVWLLRSFLETIPVEIEEAAMVDGTSRLGAFFRVILPLAGPGIVTVATFSFITAWGEYMFSAILMFKDTMKTVPTGLAMYMGYQYIEWGMLLTGSVIAVIPVLLLFLPLANLFLKGLTAGAVKG